MIEAVLSTIMAGNVKPAEILKKKKQLAFSAKRYQTDQPMLSDALVVIVDYVVARKQPPTVEALQEFVSVVPGTEAFSPEMRDRYKKSATAYRAALDKLKDLLEEDEHKPSTDFHLVVQSLLDSARRKLWVSLYVRAAQITDGTFQPVDKRAPALSGIRDAQRFMSEKRVLDVCADEGSVEGDLHDNLEVVRQSMLNMSETSGDRCYTRFPAIDDTVAIGPGEEYRFILLAGWTNHGKSGLLMTLLYEWLRQGKRILFIPLEFSAQEAWRRLVWLHLEHRKDLNLPSLNFWKLNPDAVTADQKDNFNALIADLKEGKSMPGRIEVRQLRDWPDIVEMAESAAVPYDILAIDYIAHLSHSAKTKFEGIGNIFREAQKLSHTYRDHKGLLVVSPIQTGKAGVQIAEDAADEGEYDWGRYNQSNCIDTWTDALRDADITISVWQKGYLREEGLCKVDCLKSRGPYFEPFISVVNPLTRHFGGDGGHNVVRALSKPAKQSKRTSDNGGELMPGIRRIPPASAPAQYQEINIQECI